jgi:CubicO group peptidase (beta-lactamase class C family)
MIALARRTVTLGALAVFALPARLGATQDDPGARVDELMARYTDGPGTVIGVVRDGELVFAGAYGLANIEHGVPMRRETVLDIGSVAKQFTAFAVALLADQGKLSLDEDIRTYLPAVPDFGSTITVRHLVHHMSGLREIYNAKALAGWQPGDGISQGDAQHLTSRMRQLNFEPGSEYLYCNTGYMLLADIVAEASGMTFPEFMEENVFEPVGMTSTTIMSRLGQSIPGAAESYGPEGDDGFVRIFDNSSLFGAGGIYTTVDDLARWMANLGTEAVGGEAVQEQIRERGVLNDGDTLSYAFGLTLGERRGLRTISHGGSSAGYRASFTYLPELDGGVITMSNHAAFDGSIGGQVAEAFFGEHMEAVAEEETGEAADDERPAEVQVAEAVLEDYVGEYEIAPTFVLYITREGSTLFGRATGQGRNPLWASSDTTFHLRDIASVTFHLEEDGTVSGLTLHQNGDRLAPRRPPVTLSSEEMAALAGRYYSPELETIYTLVVEDGALVAKHRRHSDFELEVTAEGTLVGAGFFGTAVIERNEAGEPTGMRVSNGRVRNLLFEKMSR